MKKLLLVFLILFSFAVKAEDVEKLVHNSKTYVDDYANVLSDDEESALDAKIRQFKSKSSAEFSVVTVQNLGGLEVEDFTNQLANRWGVGTKLNNGCMILLAMDERKLRTEVGYELEEYLTDYLTKHVQETEAVPYLKQKNYYKAFDAMLDNYITEIDPVAKAQKEAAIAKANKETEAQLQAFGNTLLNLLFLAITAFVVYFITKTVLRIRKDRKAETEKTYTKHFQTWKLVTRSIERLESLKKSGFEFETEELLQQLKALNFTQNDKRNIKTIVAETVSGKVAYDQTLAMITKLEQFQHQVQEAQSKLESREFSDFANKTARNSELLESKLETYIKQYPGVITGVIKSIDYDTKCNIINNNIKKAKNLLIEKKYDDVFNLVRIIENDMLKVNEALSIQEQPIVKVNGLLNQIRECESWLKSKRVRFYELCNKSYITDIVKNSSLFDELCVTASDCIHDINSTLNTKLIKFAKIRSDIEKQVLNPIEASEAIEQKRLNDIAAEEKRRKDEIERIAQAQRDAEESERRRIRRRREEEEERSRASYNSSSYSSSSSSSSYSSGSDFGGGSFGGGGSSSSW